MARKQDVAGLAALAGLGMLMARKKGGEGGVSQRQIAADRDASEMPDNSGGITDDMRKRAIDEGNKVSEGERVSRYKPNPFDVEDARTPDMPAAKPAAVDGTRPALKPMSERYQPQAARPNQNFSNEGRRGPVGQTSVSAADQIPGQSVKAPTGGERVDSSEAERNINAALTATGVGAGGAAAYKAKKMYDASQKAKAAGEIASAGREAVTNPLAWMAGPKNAGKFSGEVPSAGREAVTNPMAWMGGPKNMGKFEEAAPSAIDKAKEAALKFAERFKKKPLSEADTTGGAVGYKRGGKVKGYASGGSVSSASRRADGIATKGKTRGKMV